MTSHLSYLFPVVVDAFQKRHRDSGRDIDESLRDQESYFPAGENVFQFRANGSFLSEKTIERITVELRAMYESIERIMAE